MPRSQSAVVLRRRVRSSLRKLRTNLDLTQKEVADSLDWSPTKLMRIEIGKVSIDITDLRALLARYGVHDEALVDVARSIRTAPSSISARYKDALDEKFAEFVDNEEAASIIRQFEPDVIPGPLQTAEYAKAALTNLTEQDISESTIDQRVAARLERKAMLTQPDGPQAFFIIDQSAMLRHAGAESNDSSLMAKQLNHLRELGAYPNITIQVMLFSAGIYPGLRSPYVVLEFDDPLDDGLLYIETPQEELVTKEDLGEIARYIERFQSMEKKATRPEALNSAIDWAFARLKDETSLSGA